MPFASWLFPLTMLSIIAAHAWTTVRFVRRPMPGRTVVVAVGALATLPALLYLVAATDVTILALGTGTLGGVTILLAVLVAAYVGVQSLVAWSGRVATWLVLASLVVGASFLLLDATGAPGALQEDVLGAVLALSALAIGAGAAPACSRWAASGGRARRTLPFAVLGALVLLAPPLLLVAVIAVTEPPLDAAHHTYAVEIEAAGPYDVIVPFIVAKEARGADILDALHERLRVVEGSAELAWIDDGARLRITGEGTVALRASYRYFGDIGEREAFLGWALASYNVTRGEVGAGPVSVALDLSFSGGEGHTCWSDVKATAVVRAGETVPLHFSGDFEELTPEQLPRLDGFPGVCA